MKKIPPLELNLHRQQSRAINCPGDEVLFGGAAGGGKSHLIRAAHILWASKVPGLNTFIFRRTYPELVLNHLTGPGNFHEMLSPWVNAGLVEIVKGEIRFWHGSTIYLRHLQNEKDRYKYQGAEIHALSFDEATHFVDDEYRYIRGRLRLGGLKVPKDCPWKFPRVLNGTNPGGIGHLWCKEGFVDNGAYHLTRATKEEGGMLRCYIPSRLEDNPTMMETDPDYVTRLEGLGDPILVRSLREGDWSIVAGAMFGDVWRRDRHICDPFDIPPDWDLWVGIDDGMSAPAVVIWLTRDPRDDTFYAVAEVARSNMLPQEFADRVKERHAEIRRAGRRAGDPFEYEAGPVRGLMDSGAFSDQGQAEISRGNQLKRLGLQIRPVEKWPESPRDRAQNLHRLLAPNPKRKDGLPCLRVFRGMCPELVRTLPVLPRDPNRPDRVDTTANDHAFDALTYGLQWIKSTVQRRRVGGI